MSTALTVHRAPATAVTRPVPPSIDFGQLWQMAEQLVPTGMLPDWIKTPGQACAIILAGQELGMQPMRALRSLQMVKGKVTESADSQLARFKSDGGHAQFTTLDETQAVLVLRHPNGDEHTETFTIEDARKAGLVTAGGMYGKYAKAMLRSRAITAGLKSIGWEGGSGVYDASELPAFEQPRPPAPVVSEPEEMTAAQHTQIENLLGGLADMDLVAKVRTRLANGMTQEKAAEAIRFLEAQPVARPAYTGGDVPPGGKIADALTLTAEGA